MGDILATLQSEHDELRKLFSSLKATADSDVGARKQLLHDIEQGLVPHAKWEETVFYPAFAKRASHEQLLQHAEAITEHRAVEKAVLPDVHAADFNSRQFAGSSLVLGEMIEHHAAQEEQQMFRSARQLFSPDELAALDKKYADWKESSMGTVMTAYAKIKTSAVSALRSPQAPG